MVAVKTDAQVSHLADNGLPVTSADVRRLVAEKTRLRAALEFIAQSDDIENMLDPERNKRFARAALRSEQGESHE